MGDGPSHVVLEALRGDPAQLKDHLCYLTRTRDGKILKSTTLYIRGDDGVPIGIFGINYDITLMMAMENQLKQFTATEQESKEPEAISRNVRQAGGQAGGPDEQGGQGEGHPVPQ